MKKYETSAEKFDFNKTSLANLKKQSYVSLGAPLLSALTSGLNTPIKAKETTTPIATKTPLSSGIKIPLSSKIKMTLSSGIKMALLDGLIKEDKSLKNMSPSNVIQSETNRTNVIEKVLPTIEIEVIKEKKAKKDMQFQNQKV